MVKRAGTGSVGQKYGSEDPDPYQNVTDPEHCFKLKDADNWAFKSHATVPSKIK